MLGPVRLNATALARDGDFDTSSSLGQLDQRVDPKPQSLSVFAVVGDCFMRPEHFLVLVRISKENENDRTVHQYTFQEALRWWRSLYR